MKKVFLLSPPYLKNYMRNGRCDFVSNSGTQWYPVWLGMCGAFLEHEGYEVSFLDAPAAGLGRAEAMARFMAFKPDLLVVYTGKLSEESDLAFTNELLHVWGCQVVLVGPFFSIDPAATLGKGGHITLGVRGEFERPLLALLGGADPGQIAGMLVRHGEDVVETPPAAYLGRAELDALPFVSPFFHTHVDCRHYRTPSEPYPFTDIMTGRGCAWGHCIYCLWVSSFIKGKRYNTRSIENVLDELQYIETHMPHIRSVMLQDDTFPAERATELAEAKLRRGIRLRWSCYSRADLELETMKVMRRAGCLNLHVGFESGSETILKTIRKGLTRERMSRFAKEAKQAGLRIHGDFAIGFPGETPESVKETVDWACSMRPHTAQFQLMIPFPGTEFDAILQKKGWIADGAPQYPGLSWDEMESLAKAAYRRYYVSLPYLMEVARHPLDLGFQKLGAYAAAIPAIFWKKWNVR